MKLIFNYKFRFYSSKMNEICLHCHWLYFSSIILSFGRCELVWYILGNLQSGYRTVLTLLQRCLLTFSNNITCFWPVFFRCQKEPQKLVAKPWSFQDPDWWWLFFLHSDFWVFFFRESRWIEPFRLLLLDLAIEWNGLGKYFHHEKYFP